MLFVPRRLRRSLFTLLCGAMASVAFASSAAAHFIWLHLEAGPEGPVVHIRFSEDAATNEPALLDRLAGLDIKQCRPGEACLELEPTRRFDTLVAALGTPSIAGSIVTATHDLGVMTRGEATFQLRYAAKTGPAVGSEVWTQAPAKAALDLDVVPTWVDGQVVLTALWKGQPVSGAEIVGYWSNSAEFTATTDSQGQARFTPAAAGTASIRVRHIDPVAGEVAGQAFTETRYYTTVALPITIEQVGQASAIAQELPRLPQVVTSFGAAMVDGTLYVYGGHMGDAHQYVAGDQDHVLRKLDIAGFEQTGAGEWQTLIEGPALQGLALVPHGNSVIRIGGFTARNTDPAEQDLWSTDEVARYSPETNAWEPLPSLPEPRSSHDAVVLGGKLYVVGGWQLAGSGNTTWHKTAWSLELDKADAQWEALPDVPFVRRALALAAFEGKLYVLGGMEEQGGPTTKVSCFDPATQSWSEQPALPGQGMSGFGCSGFATGGKLYVSTIGGELLERNDDGTWTLKEKLKRSRFFHRMLPLDAERLIMVGGGSMEEGKFDQLDVVNVGALN